MSDRPITGGRPPDGANDWDCQCARCGSSTTWIECEHCDSDYPGYVSRYEEDPLWYDEDDLYRCDYCLGSGGWQVCVSEESWCNANPMTDRSEVYIRGAVEWFKVSREIEV